MPFVWAGIIITALCILIFTQMKRRHEQQQLEQHSITPEDLYPLMKDGQVLLYDIRLPLDLLANSEMIPGAKRIPPKDIMANPHLIPKDQDTVVYCTCPSDKTSRFLISRALSMDFTRAKFLKGGLEGWKAAGYPVEPYTESFSLDTGT